MPESGKNVSYCVQLRACVIWPNLKEAHRGLNYVYAFLLPLNSFRVFILFSFLTFLWEVSPRAKTLLMCSTFYSVLLPIITFSLFCFILFLSLSISIDFAVPKQVHVNNCFFFFFLLSYTWTPSFTSFLSIFSHDKQTQKAGLLTYWIGVQCGNSQWEKRKKSKSDKLA